ncbi:MAG: hypothetical protein R2991_11405 [Thermoanaerobaculia bacterium]
MTRRILPMALAALAAASGAVAEGGPPAVADLDVRYALLLGTRDADATAGVESDQEALSQTVLEWDPARDEAELRRLFGLQRLAVRSYGEATVSPRGGRVTATSTAEGQEFEFRIDIRHREDDVVDARCLVLHGGEVLSAPTVRTRLGERAILTSFDPERSLFLFFVFEIGASADAGP